MAQGLAEDLVNQTLLPVSLLSDAYRELNAELHQREPSYGTTGRRYVDVVRSLARKLSARHILDYGCGKCDLWAALKGEIEVRNFDPALPGLDARPDPADVVACIDVLEHVEPEYLESVLADLARVTLKAALFTIATRPALKLLADGTNPHRIIEQSPWWLERLGRYFRVTNVDTSLSGGCLQVIAESSQRFEQNEPDDGGAVELTSK